MRANVTLGFIKTRLNAFASNGRGSVAVVFSLLAVPALLFIGAAVDYSHAFVEPTEMQEALDAAVLAGVRQPTGQRDATATAVFNANFQSSQVQSTSATFSDDGRGNYTGAATATYPTSIMSIGDINSIALGAKAGAVAAVADNSCVLALAKGQAASYSAITLNGNPSVNLAGCSLQSNASMTCNGHGGNASASLAVGAASGCSNPVSGAPAVPDIYAGVASNITQKCGSTLYSLTWTPGNPPVSPGLITVNRGTYTEYHVCGDLTLSGSGNLTGSAPTSDSIIVIENGGLVMAGSADITTVQTAFVLTGDNTHNHTISFPNGHGHAASLAVSPPTNAADPWRGISIYEDPSLTANIDNDWGPGSSLSPNGVIYMPNSNLTMHGNGNSTNTLCTKILVNTLTSNGNVNFNFGQTNANCAALGVQQYSTAARLFL